MPNKFQIWCSRVQWYEKLRRNVWKWCYQELQVHLRRKRRYFFASWDGYHIRIRVKFVWFVYILQVRYSLDFLLTFCWIIESLLSIENRLIMGFRIFKCFQIFILLSFLVAKQTLEDVCLGEDASSLAFHSRLLILAARSFKTPRRSSIEYRFCVSIPRWLVLLLWNYLLFWWNCSHSP